MSRLDLNLSWDILNDVCFGGELVRPRIYAYSTLVEYTVTNRDYITLYGAYQPGYNNDRNEILIFKNQSDKDKLETLFHEMVHQYVDEVLDRPACHHGKIFWEVYNEGLEKLNAAKFNT